MSEVLDLIKTHGLGVFLIGVITCILIEVIKAPIKLRVLSGDLTEAQKARRAEVFDTIAFLSTYVMAFIGATVYYLIVEDKFSFLGILGVTLPVWMAQSMTFGIWKKLGLKRCLQYVLRLMVQDLNNDGEISLDEILAQLNRAYHEGKIDLETIVNDVVDNATETFPGVIEEAVKETGTTKEQEAVAKAQKGDPSDLVEQTKEKIFILKDGGQGVEEVSPAKVVNLDSEE